MAIGAFVFVGLMYHLKRNHNMSWVKAWLVSFAVFILVAYFIGLMLP